MPHLEHRPNLFLVGAAKSGTSWLHQRLATHPEIFMCEPKEPFYFVDPARLKKLWPEMYFNGYWKSLDAYLSLFSSAGDAKIIGESSTGYTMTPVFDEVVGKIHDFNPNAKIIYIMRHPTARLKSHYWHHVRNRGLNLAPVEALEKQPLFLAASDYPRQLRPYLEKFGREPVYALSFARFQENPKLEYVNILKWLDVEASHVPPDLTEKEHVTPPVVRSPRSPFLKRLTSHPTFARVRDALPSAAIDQARRLTHRKIQREKVDLRDLDHELHDLHEKQIDELRKLLDDDFPEWRM